MLSNSLTIACLLILSRPFCLVHYRFSNIVLLFQVLVVKLTIKYKLLSTYTAKSEICNMRQLGVYVSPRFLHHCHCTISVNYLHIGVSFSLCYNKKRRFSLG